MQIAESLAMKGRITITRTNAEGKVTLYLEKDNLIVTTGKNFAAAALLAASPSPFTHIAVGSGAVAPALADTALGSEIARSAFSSSSRAANVVNMSVTMGPGVGTGALTEAGIFNASTAGTLFSRVTFPVVNKGAADTITVTWQITVG
jgi:hypothetical protein